MNLSEIISGLEAQQAEPATLGLPFDDRMQRLVDYVYQEKYNAKIQELIRSENCASRRRIFRVSCMKAGDLTGRFLGTCPAASTLTPTRASSCRDLPIRQDIPGLCPGETCMPQPNQFRALYIRLPDLLMEYGDCAAIIGSPKNLLNQYGKIPLLILDEWLVSDISDSELYFLFELMERRSDSTSTIFCTQYRKDDWIKRLGKGVHAEAIVDRYAHTAYWIETGSMNMREYFAKPRK